MGEHPAGLTSTYELFVNDLDFVASWLASIAKARGCPPELLQPKGAHQDNDHAIPLQDLAPLAEYISYRRKKVKVPADVSKTIVRVVAFANGLECRRTRGVADGQIDTSCIAEVLAKVGQLLKVPVTISKAKFPRPFLGTDLEHLLLYDIDERDFLVTFEQRKMFTTTSGIAYTVRLPKSRENALLAMAMLTADLSKISHQIMFGWMRFLDGDLDVSPAAIVSHAGMDFARGLIHQMAPMFDEFGGTCAVARGLFEVHAVAAGYSPKRAEYWMKNGLKNCPLPYSSDMSRFAALCFLQKLTLDTSERSLLLQATLPIPPKTTGPIDSRVWRFRQDVAIFIGGLFAEVCLLLRLVPDYPVDDTFISGVREFLETGKLTFELVFAAQVHVDVHFVMVHDTRARINNIADAVIQQIEGMQVDIEHHFDFHSDSEPVPDWQKSLGKQLTALQEKMKVFTDDPLLLAKQQLAEKLGIPAAGMLMKHGILERSTILAGLALCHFQAGMCNLGLALETQSASITCTMHLYHAVHTEKYLKVTWPDLELVKMCGHDKGMFVDKIPTCPAEYLSSFLLIHRVAVVPNGETSRVEAVNGRCGLRSRMRPGFIPDGVMAFSLLRILLCESSSPVEWTPERIGFITSNWPAKRKTPKDGLVSRTTMMEGLRPMIELEAGVVSFPFITMHRSCRSLLRFIRRFVDMVLPDICGAEYAQQESELPLIVGQILLLATQTNKDRADLFLHLGAVAFMKMKRSQVALTMWYMGEGYAGHKWCNMKAKGRMIEDL